MSQTILSLDNVHVGYGNKVVVHNVSLDVGDGDFVSVLGPSGSGKSTILRAIAGFSPVVSGRIMLNGKDISRLPPEQRDVGIVFQNYALFPTMTAFQNIAFGLRVAKTPAAEIEERVTRIAEISGISEHLHKKPGNMSGGQQQRVAVARALVMGSRVLLFDEPLSNLDAKVRVVMRQEIKRMQRQFGFTAVFVTHDQEDALTMSDQIMVLRDGRIEQVADGRTMYQRPQNPFVCQFIGASNELTPQQYSQLFGREIAGRVFVRLEDILIGSSGDKGAVATVKNIEFLGAQSRIDLDFAGAPLSCLKIGTDLPAIDEEVPVTIREGSEHIFSDPEDQP